MPQRTARSRLVNAILYFASHASHVGKIKLFKLIYLFDFEHFRQTGSSVTDLSYQAWRYGPVPAALMEEWEHGFDPDIAAAVHVEPERVIDYLRLTVVPNPEISADEREFTPRQLAILRNLIDQYGETFSPEMIDVTHAQNGAWDKVWKKGEGSYQPIPYELALSQDSESQQEVLSHAATIHAFKHAFG